MVRGSLDFHVEVAPAFDYARATHRTTLIESTTRSTTCYTDNQSARFECPTHLDLDLRVITSKGAAVALPKITVDYLDLSERGHQGLGIACDFTLSEGQSVIFVLRQPPVEVDGQEIELLNDLNSEVTNPLSLETSNEDPLLNQFLIDSLFNQTQSFWLKWCDIFILSLLYYYA
jgi:hypothetical protein